MMNIGYYTVFHQYPDSHSSMRVGILVEHSVDIWVAQNTSYKNISFIGLGLLISNPKVVIFAILCKIGSPDMIYREIIYIN